MLVWVVASLDSAASMPLISMVWVGGAFQRKTALMKPATPSQFTDGSEASTNEQ